MTNQIINGKTLIKDYFFLCLGMQVAKLYYANLETPPIEVEAVDDIVLFDLDGNDFGIAPKFLLTPLIVLFERANFSGSGVSILAGFRKIGGRKSPNTLLLTSRTRSARWVSVFFSAMLFMIASHLPGARGFRDSEK
jgi:hypothetical protein